MYAILQDPNRSLSELTTQDIRNLSSVAVAGNYAKNAASVKTVKETKSTFDVAQPGKKTAKVDITDKQLTDLKGQKTPEAKKTFLKGIVDEKIKAGELPPDMATATPIVDKYKLKVWQSAPIKGTANIKSKEVPVDWVHKVDDDSAWSRYLAKTREGS
jgi:hypothetical protein